MEKSVVKKYIYLFSNLSPDNIIEFDIQFQDNADGGGDPNVTGDILSSITHRRPSGTYVSVPSPTYNNTSEL